MVPPPPPPSRRRPANPVGFPRSSLAAAPQDPQAATGPLYLDGPREKPLPLLNCFFFTAARNRKPRPLATRW